MDSIRVPKVENVTFTKSGKSSLLGTLHLTAHHLIFRFEDANEKELWFPYPLISLVSRLPQTLQGLYPLSFQCRTFEAFTLSLQNDLDASDVFDSIKELTVAPSIYQLYAFFYSPNPPLLTNTGWSRFSPREEFGRMGVGTRTKAWRFTDLNKDYSFCPTYPAKMAVPTRISDTTLQYAAKYRSKCRIPLLAYLHWSNFGTITRSSQPMVGITQNRSVQDEKLIEAIFQSHHNPESRVSSSPVYGATTTNLIIDARPTANAVANTAKGAGTENMDHYKDAKKAYLGIDNIHNMRDSLTKVVEALRDADAMLTSINNDLQSQVSNISLLDRQALRRSGWLRHITNILEGTLLITKNIHINSSHVLIHCSDGWDRTSQLSSLAQLCLDPFYRTIRGFEILIEKDWLSYGHRFLDRCGHLSSDKFFISTNETSNSGTGADAAQSFLASVQNRFVSQHHIKETSPVFHQFLECVHQLQRQFPKRFEFNQRFLYQLYYHLYSCQFGTFLFNCERDRRVGENGSTPPFERTVSIWDFLNSPPEKEQNVNADYDPSLDDPSNRSSDMGVIYPNPKDVRFWNELYGRTDEEMNGRASTPAKELAAEPLDQELGVERAVTPLSVPLPQTPAQTPSRSTTPAPLTTDDLSRAGSSITINQTSRDNLNRLSPLQREESFRPIDSTTSAFSLKPTATQPTSPSPSPNRGGLKTPDFLNSANVRSVWGKLSSSASAAFSTVQEAYEGVARDFRNPNVASSDPNVSRSEEFQTRGTLVNWGEDHEETSSYSAATLTRYSTVPKSNNPWATAHRADDHFQSLDAMDNPWNSTKPLPKSPKQDNILSGQFFDPPTNLLPLDSTIPPIAKTSSIESSTIPPVITETLSAVSTTRNVTSSPQPTLSQTNQATPISSEKEKPTVSNTDPLGVGLV